MRGPLTVRLDSSLAAASMPGINRTATASIDANANRGILFISSPFF
jgi:hypothetical protein